MLALDLHPYKDFKMNRITQRLLDLNGFFAEVERSFSFKGAPLSQVISIPFYIYMISKNKIKKSKMLTKD